MCVCGVVWAVYCVAHVRVSCVYRVQYAFCVVHAVRVVCVACACSVCVYRVYYACCVHITCIVCVARACIVCVSASV